jgi:hypothetical protein
MSSTSLGTARFLCASERARPSSRASPDVVGRLEVLPHARGEIGREAIGARHGQAGPDGGVAGGRPKRVAPGERADGARLRQSSRARGIGTAIEQLPSGSDAERDHR